MGRHICFLWRLTHIWVRKRMCTIIVTPDMSQVLWKIRKQHVGTPLNYLTKYFEKYEVNTPLDYIWPITENVKIEATLTSTFHTLHCIGDLQCSINLMSHTYGTLKTPEMTPHLPLLNLLAKMTKWRSVWPPLSYLRDLQCSIYLS